MDLEDFVSAREAGEMLNVNRARIGVLCREGRFSGAKKIRLGWMIPRESVLNFVRLAPGLKPKNSKKDKEFLSDILKQIKGKQQDDKQR